MSLLLNKKLNNEKFPLGGIGTGCVEIDKSGAFTGILLHNSVNVQFFERFFLEFVVKITDSFGNCRVFALKDGKCTFSFPYAYCTYECEDLPITINMTAFNPFIPNNMVDSAIPAIYFDIELENRTEGDLFFSCALVSKNIFDECRNKNGLSKDAEIKYVRQLDITPREYDLQNVGELIVSSNSEDVSFLENFRYDTEQEKNEFFSLFEREPFFDCKNKDDSLGRFSALCAHTDVGAGESESLSFVYAWHFPFVFNKWSTNFEDCNIDAEILKNNVWQNCYTSFFDDSAKCAEYCFVNKESLKERTDAYFNALKNANIDEDTLRAVLKSLYFYKYPSNILVLRGAEVYFIDDSEDEYSRTPHSDFSFAYLFPHWARKQRIIEFCSLTDDDGNMNFCTTKSLEHIYELESSCTDRFYSVLKAYREFAYSADMPFLKEIWEKVKLVFDAAYIKVSPNFSDIFFMQSCDACLMLCAQKAMLDLSIAVKERKTIKRYTQQYYEFLSAFEKYLEDSKYNYFQILCNEICQNFGLCEVFNRKRILNTLEDSDFDENDPLYLSALLRCGKYEQYKKKLSECTDLILQGVSVSDYVFSQAPSAFCLYTAYLGLFFNKNLQKLHFAPKISFSNDGTFTYPLCFAEIFGFIEIGADYFQIKLYSGAVSVKEIKIHTIPYTLLYGGRRMGFSKSGNCALLDFDIEINSKKDIMIWI